MSPNFKNWNETVSKGFDYLPNSTIQQTASLGTKIILSIAIVLLVIALIWLIGILAKKGKQRRNDNDREKYEPNSP